MKTPLTCESELSCWQCVRAKSAGRTARLALLAGSPREGLRVRAKQARKGREGFWPSLASRTCGTSNRKSFWWLLATKVTAEKN